MKLMVLKPFQLKTKDGPKLYKPGEVFESVSPKAQAYIKEGFFKPVEEPKAPGPSRVGCGLPWEGWKG